MAKAEADTKRRWAISGAAGAAAALAIVSGFRLPQEAPRAAGPAPREVRIQQVTEGGDAVGAAAALRDLTPLFLPTGRNALPARSSPRAIEPSFYQASAASAERAAAAWHFDRLPPAVALKGSRIPPDAAGNRGLLLDYLDDASLEALAAGMGRAPVVISQMLDRGGFVEVVGAGSGRRVFAEELAAGVRPPTEKIWQPLEFVANVGPAGLVRPLSLTVRSGVDEVDDFFKNYLARTFRVGERLAPGFYRITVAP